MIIALKKNPTQPQHDDDIDDIGPEEDIIATCLGCVVGIRAHDVIVAASEFTLNIAENIVKYDADHSVRLLRGSGILFGGARTNDLVYEILRANPNT